MLSVATTRSRSVSSRRRFPRPVRSSVIDSCRVSAKSCAFSRSVKASRTRTSTSVAAASVTATRLRRSKWSTTRIPIPMSAPAVGTARRGRPLTSSRASPRTATHPDAAIRSVASGQRTSIVVPAW